MARQGFMAPAPSHSSSSRDVDAGSRTFTHHESTVSSLHRIAEANIAVEGLRNTCDIFIADRRVLPPSHSGSKHRWWEGLRNTWTLFNFSLPDPSTCSPSIAQWPFSTKISFKAPSPTLTAEPSSAGGKPIGLRAAKPARLMLLRHAP